MLVPDSILDHPYAVASKFTATLGVLVDVVMNSGDVVVSLVFSLGLRPEVILGLLGPLQRLIPRLPWLPDNLASVLQQAMTLVLIAVVVVNLLELLSTARSSLQNSKS